jgi:hypothetical protein
MDCARSLALVGVGVGGLVVRERELRQSWWSSVECAPQPTTPNQTAHTNLHSGTPYGLCVAAAPITLDREMMFRKRMPAVNMLP